MVPESLGRYRILRLLGSGGMGEVFEGYDDRLERPVAIKGIHHDRVSPERRERLRREALSTAALSHPAITHIYEILTEADTDWVVMEFVEGSSLAEVIVKGPPSPAEVASIGAEIAEALAEAHRRGIVHRDIKTENVMLTPAGHVKVLDFGLAKWVGGRASSDDRLTSDGLAVGTTRAMSPEQALGRDVDSRSDIFSLGSTLYELATGKPAFHGTTPMETMHKVARCEFEPLVEVGPGLPAALVSVIERCMAREPGDRYQTADGLARDLRRVASSATDATAAEPAVRASVILVAARAHWLAVIAAAAAVTAVAVAGEMMGWFAPRRTPTVAVLPFVNLSGDPGQEYLADGMTEELITALSRISALRVVSRTSVMRFKGTTKPLHEIAAALGAEGVLEGSVLRAGERVRITAQLINAATDTHLWAESYDRDLKDVLALQSDVALAVAGEVRAKVTPQEQTRLAGVRPVNPDAYEAYLKGRHLMYTFSEEEYGKGLDYFKRAIDLDPTWAPAYAALGNSYVRGGLRGYHPPYETIQKAKPPLQKALELDEGLAEAHAVLGMVLLQSDWD